MHGMGHGAWTEGMSSCMALINHHLPKLQPRSHGPSQHSRAVMPDRPRHPGLLLPMMDQLREPAPGRLGLEALLPMQQDSEQPGALANLRQEWQVGVNKCGVHVKGAFANLRR